MLHTCSSGEKKNDRSRSEEWKGGGGLQSVSAVLRETLPHQPQLISLS